jgi:outer membrane protein assembly factor BamB
MRAAGTGQPRCSVALPGRAVSAILVGACGRWFASTDRHVVAILDGSVDWIREGKISLGQPSALPDGTLVLAEERGQRLVAIDRETGGERWAIPAERWSLDPPLILPNGCIAHTRALGFTETAIDLLEPSGRLLWSQRVPSGVPQRAVAIGDLLVVSDGRCLRAFDPQGACTWVADPRGFFPGTSDAELETADEPLEAAPMAIDETHLLTRGKHACLYDVRERTVRRWPAGPESSSAPGPAAVLEYSEVGRSVAMVRGLTLELFDVGGEPRWRHEILSPAQGIATDGAGKVIVSYGVTAAFWDEYQAQGNLESYCGVCAFDAEGELAFRWSAPGPLSPAIALTGTGLVLVAVDGRLWAIG